MPENYQLMHRLYWYSKAEDTKTRFRDLLHCTVSIQIILF